jgi:N-acetylmuramoyl-L-alanine amidase
MALPPITIPNITIPKIDLSKLNNAMSGLANKQGLDQISTAAAGLQGELAATLTTKLGGAVGAIEGGFQSLTQEIDIAELESGINTVVGKGMALLADNPPGVNLKQAISSVNIDALKDLTGLVDEMKPGLNSVIASLPTPEAIGATLKGVSGLNLSELQDAMSSISPPNLSALAASASIKQLADIDFSGLTKGFSKSVSTALGGVNTFLDKGFGQPLKDLVEATTGGLKSVVTSLTQDTGKLIPNDIQKQFAGLIDKSNALDASKLLEPFSNFDASSIETAISGISTKISDNVEKITGELKAAMPASTATVLDVGTNDKAWKAAATSVREPGAGTSIPSTTAEEAAAKSLDEIIAFDDLLTSQNPFALGVGRGTASLTDAQKAVRDKRAAAAASSSGFSFTRISRLEELEAEIRSATREITEVVIHWTEHFADQDVGSEEIHLTHTGGIGYHYVVRKDGTIQRGRPVNIVGEHAPALGHNQYSIAIAIVAGFTCNSETPDPSKYLSESSINSKQFVALEDFLRIFYRVFPGGNVLGHYQCTDDEDIDPGFDVESYIKETFGKQNAITFDNTIGPLTRSDLVLLRKTLVKPKTTASTQTYGSH